jgi:hypothetical protein
VSIPTSRVALLVMAGLVSAMRIFALSRAGWF